MLRKNQDNLLKVASAIIPEVALDPQRKRWTVEEAYRIAELLPGRWELIEGDLINKIGQNPLHACVITLLNDVLSRAFPSRIRIQLPLTLVEPDCRQSEPEPDVVVLYTDIRDFRHRHPGSQDTALVIEVSDTTIDMDRKVKSRLYARAGIVEYWVIDIQNRRTIVHRRPAGDEYASVEIVQPGELMAPQLGALEQPLTLDNLLG